MDSYYDDLCKPVRKHLLFARHISRTMLSFKEEVSFFLITGTYNKLLHHHILYQRGDHVEPKRNHL